ncbi:hypothetical protein DOY81_002227 [Sarcophaga bullata]|nr:hypothetical protein DOY81_002227 [Sarcophaga bullata]
MQTQQKFFCPQHNDREQLYQQRKQYQKQQQWQSIELLANENSFIKHKYNNNNNILKIIITIRNYNNNNSHEHDTLKQQQQEHQKQPQQHHLTKQQIQKNSQNTIDVKPKATIKNYSFNTPLNSIIHHKQPFRSKEKTSFAFASYPLQFNTTHTNNYIFSSSSFLKPCPNKTKTSYSSNKNNSIVVQRENFTNLNSILIRFFMEFFLIYYNNLYLNLHRHRKSFRRKSSLTFSLSSSALSSSLKTLTLFIKRDISIFQSIFYNTRVML